MHVGSENAKQWIMLCKKVTDQGKVSYILWGQTFSFLLEIAYDRRSILKILMLIIGKSIYYYSALRGGINNKKLSVLTSIMRASRNKRRIENFRLRQQNLTKSKYHFHTRELLGGLFWKKLPGTQYLAEGRKQIFCLQYLLRNGKTDHF